MIKRFDFFVIPRAVRHGTWCSADAGPETLFERAAGPGLAEQQFMLNSTRDDRKGDLNE